MKLKLFIDIFNRKLVTSATSDLPVSLPDFFREDHVELEIQLLEPTGSMTSPLSIVDISSLSIQAAIGNPGSNPDALQTTFTKDTTNNKFTGTINLQTTEMVAAFTAAGASIERFLEVEVEGTSTQYHTVLQQLITLHRDIITHPTVSPSDVTSGSAFANSFAATAEDSTTVQWTASGDYNYAHIKGMSGVSSLTAGKFIKVNSGGTGFEETDITLGSTSVDALSDVDTSTSGPTTNASILRWNGTNWVPLAHAIGNLNDVDTASTSPATNHVLTYTGSKWEPAAAQTANQNLWSTVKGDSGSSTPGSTSSDLEIKGGAGIDTISSSGVVTVSGELASTTNIGIASFSDDDFSVASGHVSLDAISLAKGGTGSTNKQDAFDNLSPLSTAGDLIVHDGSDNTRLPIGTAGQQLAVNSSANGVEWVAAGGGGTTYTAGDGLDLTSTEFSADLKANGGIVIESTEMAVDLGASSITGTLAVADGGTGATSLNNLITLGTHSTGDYVSTITGGSGIASTGATSGETIAHSLSLDVNGLTDVGTTTFGATTFGAGDYIAVADASDSNNVKKVKMPAEIMVAVSDETSALTAGLNKLVFRMPHAMTLTDIRASVTTAPVGSTIIVDVNESGSTILSTKLSIDAGEKTSTTAAQPAVISDAALADDAEISVDIDQIGSSTAGAALKLTLIGYR